MKFSSQIRKGNPNQAEAPIRNIIIGFSKIQLYVYSIQCTRTILSPPIPSTIADWLRLVTLIINEIQQSEPCLFLGGGGLIIKPHPCRLRHLRMNLIACSCINGFERIWGPGKIMINNLHKYYKLHFILETNS